VPPGRRPAPLRLRVRLVAAAVLVGLVGWFAVELVTQGQRLGLAERMAAGTQSLWPLVVVVGSVVPVGRRGRA
jgi:purine-cytosine permease-like protein